MERKSIGAKNLYISITRESFVKLIPFIKNLQEKFFVFETGEKLIFAEYPLSLNFFISKIDNDNYTLKLAEHQKIDQYFIFLSSYILINNVIHKVNLPFEDETIIKIFENTFIFKQSELAYYKTLVSKQLSLFNNYLDFAEQLDFPLIADDPPKVFFLLNKNKKNKSKQSSLNIYGYFEFNDGEKIPLTIAQKEINLFKLNFLQNDKWYYIPDELLSITKDFMTKYLFFETEKMDSYEWNVTSAVEVDYIKKNLFEQNNPNWNIILSDELKSEFVQPVYLVPEIKIDSMENIDWFSYKVVYKSQNLELTHDILRNFFKSGENFFTAPDGTRFKLTNKELFDEIEDMIQINKKDIDHFYKMSIYRLPWIYELKKLNPAITIHGDKYLDEMYSALLKRSLKVSLQPHYNLRVIMRSYQKAGYEWMKMLEKFKLNGILADDMGLGKTLQAISILTDLPQDSKSLIICPKTLLFNWVAEIEKFNPQLKYIIHEGSRDERINHLQTVPVQIVLCSYNLVQNDLEEFKKITFDYLIVDEAQHIKNHTTLRSKAIKKIKARHKLAMTGTPLENSITELWSVFDFLMPGYLPSIKKFKEFAMEKSDTVKLMDKIKQYIAPFILRRKKVDVLLELPDKQEQSIYCKMTEKQEQYYIHVLNAVKESVITNDDTSVNYITMLAALTRLRQICDHPGLINDDWLKENNMSGKLEALKELVEDALENNRKILIFSQYIKMLHLIERMVKKMNVNYEYMDGSTKDRKTIINHFNNNEKVRIFLISLRTGGFGINLTAADTVILVDPWWNPMIENQAVDRVHRMGQTRKVLVYKMITKGSVEEKIMLLQKKKKDLFDNVIDGGEVALKNLEFEDIKGLFEYKE